MDMLNQFVLRGRQDKPVYITDVRRAFLSGDGADLTLDLKRFDGGICTIALRVPIAGADTAEKVQFLRDYLLAEVYNILSALGGEKLSIYTSAKDAQLTALLAELPKAFGIGISRAERVGYGRCTNIIERILESLGRQNPFIIEIYAAKEPPHISPEKSGGTVLTPALGRVFEGVKDKVMCGVDIGGTDIKLAASVNGKLCFLKEYDWFPTMFTRPEQLIEPICLLLRLLRARVSCTLADTAGAGIDGVMVKKLDEALDSHMSDERIDAAVHAAESALGNNITGFDCIGLCFPDVVIRNKVVGGEVYKTRGIRDNPDIEYESEFRKLTDLNEIVLNYCKPGGRVNMTNDGFVAAFTAAVELVSQGRDDAVRDGRFAHTLGTELGTGWIDESGSLPEIPLEIYNFIIDLGSYGAREYHPDDLRSINNFNTGLPGTLQKIMAQNGVYRLAIKASQAGDGLLYRKLIEDGLIFEKDGGVFVKLSPKDMRKPLLEYLMELCEAGDREIEEVFREIGRAAGVTFCETEHILAPRTKERVMYGRLVKLPRCFALLKEGAAEIDESLQMTVADEQSAYSALMLQLKEHPRYTVAQFAQAVGALYYGNYTNG